MKPNAMRAKLQAGEAVYGTMIQEVRSAAIGLLMAQAGCDFIFFDMEHGPYDLADVSDMIRVTRLAGITALVRVPNDDYHLMVRPMDAGAQGIMIPRVETRAQVERIMDNVLYPPKGSRGCSVSKGHNDYQSQNQWEFTEQANRENMIILQIERAKAVEHIEDLISVEGVGGIIIGPNDLFLSMGRREKDWMASLEGEIGHVLETAMKLNIPCGMHVDQMDWLLEWQRRGMKIITYSTDVNFLRQGAASGIARLREGKKG